MVNPSEQQQFSKRGFERSFGNKMEKLATIYHHESLWHSVFNLPLNVTSLSTKSYCKWVCNFLPKAVKAVWP